MRGVKKFIIALFLVGIWMFIGVEVIEPLAEQAKTTDLSAIGGASNVDTILKIYFLWAPMVFLAGWFVWGVRWYVSPNLRRQQRRR